MCCLFNVSFYWLIFIGWLHFVIANRFPITFLYTNDLIFTLKKHQIEQLDKLRFMQKEINE